MTEKEKNTQEEKENKENNEEKTPQKLTVFGGKFLNILLQN